MNQFVYLLKFFIFSIIWKSCFFVELGIRVYVTGKVETFQIPSKDNYEITIGGACGGGTYYGDGGNGGEIAGLFNFNGIEKLSIAVGEVGNSKSKTCGTTGGGGATAVFIKRGVNSFENELLMVAPGGGGGGYYQAAATPDYNGLNFALDSEQCFTSNNTYQAAEGRSINSYLNTVNLTYNPTNPNENLTAGCVGGFGGGGQGGFMLKLENYTVSSGGGGGGGGYIGGKVSVNGKTSGCTAGGPGTPYCKHPYCGVPKANQLCTGFFVIRKHELYKELPLKDRTNYEKPRVDKNVGLGGNVLSISLNCLIAGVIWNMLCKQC